MPSKNWFHGQGARRLLRSFSIKPDRSPSPIRPQSAAVISGSPFVDDDNRDASPRESTTPELAPAPAPISNTPGDTPSKTSVEEINAAQSHSRAYKNTMRVFKDHGQLAKRIEPLVWNTPLGTPMSVLIIIIDAVEAVNDADGDAETALNNLSRRLSIVDKFLDSRPESQPAEGIKEFAEFLVCEARMLYEIKGMSTWKKVLQVDERWQSVQYIVLMIDEKTKDLSIRILLSIERDTKTILERISESGLHGLMRVPSAAYMCIGDTPPREKCTEGTRVDVLKRICAWATDPSSPPIFWLSGVAGTGKSTIAYTVCHHFDSDVVGGARLCASFICSRQVKALRQLQNIIPTLAYQLARQSRSFAEAVVHADPITLYSSSEHVQMLLVTPWKQSMKDRRDELPLSLIVIDALDEIEYNGGEHLLRELIDSTGNEGVQGLKILVTSRPHPNIIAATSSLPPDTRFHLENIKYADGTQDIRTFLAYRLPALHASPSHDYRQWLEELVNLASGSFIFAATAARLTSPPDVPFSVVEQADRLSNVIRNQDMLSLDGETARGVDALYKQVLNDAIPQRHRHSCLLILHTVVCALQPLNIASLAELAAGDSKTKDEEAAELCVDALHSVLYVRAKHVYIYHKSFSDFILDEQRCGPKLACNLNAQNTYLFRACFRIMGASLHFNMRGLPSSSNSDPEVRDLEHAVKKHILDVPGLEYACRYWTSHLVKLPTNSGDPQLLNALWEFGQEKVLFWIEAMTLLGASEECRDGANAVKEWADTVPKAKTGLKATFDAASSLSMSFLQNVAWQSTPHLYIPSLIAEFATNPNIPSQWKGSFPGAPQRRCAPMSKYRGISTRIDARGLINAVAFSPDGTRVVSGLYDESVRIWDASTGEQVQMLDGHTYSVTSVAFSPDGTRVVSGSDDKSVRIWDASTRQQVRMLDGHMSSVTSVAFSPDGTCVVSGSDDKSVRIWDASTGQQVQMLYGHTDSVRSVAFSPDGTCVVSGSDDKSVQIWDALTGEKMQGLYGHTDSVTSVAFSPDGTRVVSGSDDKSVQIWDALTGEKMRGLYGHTDSVTSVAFSPDGTRVVSGSDDKSVQIWDTRTSEAQELDGHTDSVTSVAFSPSGTRIISSSFD
ncbi:hypothetical protein K488DRAFT_91838 [Vararia minispora EC-137]|uniref:Uncharacterized protein n=1 Tax=Vararia minispora EC-137 TaxID=1314806 RepID=A0ACB8Q4Y3_9AGAM|nr:hypothetical protein K488DRAFT_91838 [Vararia minispora EC-137]